MPPICRGVCSAKFLSDLTASLRSVVPVKKQSSELTDTACIDISGSKVQQQVKEYYPPYNFRWALFMFHCQPKKDEKQYDIIWPCIFPVAYCSLFFQNRRDGGGGRTEISRGKESEIESCSHALSKEGLYTYMPARRSCLDSMNLICIVGIPQYLGHTCARSKNDSIQTFQP